ncbi:MAG: FAD-binding oxidoreductase [Candidatus Acidiferrales bacterium]|jgi:ferredoxin--NADP+ reductase
MATATTPSPGELTANNTDKFYRARIVERQDLTANLWRIKVDPGGAFSHLPGQYATLGVVTTHKHVERAYSIVSAPQEGLLEFFIEMAPGGELTPLLHELRVGDSLTCRKIAKGRFTLDMQSGRKNHLLIATVTGVAPFVSMIRSLRHESRISETRHSLFLIDGASHSPELGYQEELALVAAESRWFNFVPTVSRPWDDPLWNGETGRVDDLIRKYTDAWGLTPQTTTAYLCGNPTMIENSKGILKRRGWKKDGMKDEVYFVRGHHDPQPERKLQPLTAC